MKAILDHIGIAVSDLPAALAFYRDALGLDVATTEEVTSERVRAHFIPVGESSLELLEATAADSPIATYVGRRGPGVHHITLRVENILAVLAQLKARGVRLVNEQPRAGAEGSLVAFVHPASTHGVLVELKQSRREPGTEPDRSTTSPDASVSPHTALPDSRILRHQLGDLELISLYDGYIRVDGGSMFGIVPKVLWAARARPDERNRIPLSMRPLIVKGTRTMLIDAGLGDKEHEKFCDIYGVDRARHLDHALADAGLTVSDIDIVLATHLHFDHAGGFTVLDANGRVRPRFPRARYVVRRGEWEDATRPHDRNRASYRDQNFLSLADAGVLELVDDDQTIMPGVKVQRTGGHTMHHQIVWIESGARRAVYAADLMPTTAHLSDTWSLGFDLYPVDTLVAKQAFVREVLSRETLIFFAHDPAVAAGYLIEQNSHRLLQQIL